MSGLAWLMGIVMAATLMGDGPSETVYPLKPVLAAEEAPHIATAWDDHWMEAARRQFENRRMPARRSPLALLILIGLIVIIWRQGRQELWRDQSTYRSVLGAPADLDLRHRLAPRWGLR
jgi:hypothetical protein